MTKTKNTKKALVASIISLVVCITAFLGTTFAWFTDSEVSGANKIQSGNLDIILEYSKTLEENSWKPVTENTKDIFTDKDGNGILWEPGATTVVYLRMTNAGTLALKYNLGINIINEREGTNVAGDSFKLSDYIKFGQKVFGNTDVAYATREAAVNAVNETATKLGDGYTLDGNMAPEDEQVIALVVYMPETVGDVANYKTGTAAPEIDLGVKLIATQDTVETDGFSKYYDLGADLVSSEITKTVKAGEKTVLKLGDFIQVEVPVGAKANGEALENGNTLTLKVEEKNDVPTNYTVTTPVGTKTYEIEVVKGEDKVTDGNNKIKVRLRVGETGATKVTHMNGATNEDVPFEIDGEYITFEVGSFSPYVVKGKYVAKVGTTKYESLQVALNNAHDGEIVTLLSDVLLENQVKYQSDSDKITAVLDLNNHKIVGDDALNDYLFDLKNAELTVKNGVIEGYKGFRASNTKLSLNNIKITTDYDSVRAHNNSEFILDKNSIMITTDNYPNLTVFGDNRETSTTTSDGIPTKADIYGKIYKKYAGETGSGVHAAVQGNGNDKTDGTEITLHNGAVVECVNGTAMFIPQNGIVKVDGATVTGAGAAIGIKGGKFIMTAGTLTGTGPDMTPTEGWNNGIKDSGAALQIESNDGYAGNIEVNITGGTLKSLNSFAIYEYLGAGTNTSVKAFTEIDTSKVKLQSKKGLDGMLLSDDLKAKAFMGWLN